MVERDDQIEALVAAAAAQDEGAWQALWAAIEPPLLRIVAQPRFLGRLGQHEDDRRNIVVAVMARLRAGDFKRLHIYLEAKRASPNLRFLTWLRVVAKRVGIDYLRVHPDWLPRNESHASAPGKWVAPNTLPPASQLVGERPPMTDRGTAHELLRFAHGAIPEPQVRALELWAQSESFDTIAAAIGLASAAEADKLVRAAIERLRRKYRTEEGLRGAPRERRDSE